MPRINMMQPRLVGRWTANQGGVRQWHAAPSATRPWGWAKLEGEEQKLFSKDLYRQFTRRQRAEAMLYKGTRWGFGGFGLTLPFVALSMASSQRGEKLATGISSTVGATTFPFVQGISAAGLAMLLPGLGPGFPLYASMVVAGLATSRIEDLVLSGVRGLTQAGRQMRHLETGTGYQESFSSNSLRQRATQELSSATLHSRRWLGQEARFLHR